MGIYQSIKPSHCAGIFKQYIQPIDGDTYIVNQVNPFIPDLSYRSESYLHCAYRYILKTKQLCAKVLKNGPCKQAVRSYSVRKLGRQNYEFC